MLSSRCRCAGSSLSQLSSASNAAASSGSTARSGSVVLRVSPNVLLNRTLSVKNQQILNFARPLRFPRRWSFQRQREFDARKTRTANSQRQHRRDFGNEVERVELEQHVEGEKAVDVELPRRRIQLQLRAKLRGVRGDREIQSPASAADCRPHQRQRQPPDRRQIHRRWLIGGMKATDGQQEVGVRAPVQPHRHVARQREAQQLRVEQTGIKLQLSPLEVDLAEEVHLQAQDRGVLIRQHCRATRRGSPAAPAPALRSPVPDRPSPASACPRRSSPSDQR